MPKKYRSPNRAVRVAESNHQDLIQLALRTRFDTEPLKTLSEALSHLSDPGALLEKLPPVAIEPFVMAAWLAKSPIELGRVSYVFAHLADPDSFVRIVALTSGDRASALLELVESEVVDTFRKSVALFLYAELGVNDTPDARLLNALTECLQSETSWVGLVLLGEILRNLKLAFLSASACEAIKFARSEHGTEVLLEMRRLSREPLSCLPVQRSDSGTEVRRVVYKMTLLPILSRDGYLAISLDEASKMCFSQFDARSLFEIQRQLARNGIWDASERALDELVLKVGDNCHREDYIETLLDAGEAVRARRQVEMMSVADESPVRGTLLRLAMMEGPPEPTLLALDDFSESCLRDPEADYLLDAVWALLEQYPAIGILYARGALASIPELECTDILDRIEQARSRLKLPPGDPADAIFKFLLGIDPADLVSSN